ncbi:MAG: DNA repair exonuclease [Ruminococcaceae bacterium]|nr:DNA repair exonuclease [Oscillospiraceae bacterium]
MKLIHTADLHLDSPLANFSAEQAKERRAELLDTFRRMVEFADKEGVCAILIAGDLFDSVKQVRKRTVKMILETVSLYPNIHFFYLAGNHDGGANLLVGNEAIPQNLHTFSDQWTTYDLGEASITAAQNPLPEALSLNSEQTNIILLHGQVTDTFSASGDEIPLRAYAEKGIDYLALGHIHSFAEYRVDDRAIACYSGTPEGRGFDECGEKGFVLLEITPGKRLQTRFVPFAKRTLHEIRLDLSGCNTQTELERRAEMALAPIPATDLVKLTVCGEVDPDFEPDYHRIDRYLSERFWFGRRKDESALLIRPEDYQNDRSLKGEFIRLVRADESLTDAERDAVIRIGLQALYGRKEIDL